MSSHRGGATARDDGPVMRDDYRPPAFLVDHIHLHFELGAEQTRVHSRLALRRNPAAGAADAPLHLDGESLELLAVAVDDIPLPEAAYRQDAAGLWIWNVPERFSLDTDVAVYPHRNTDLMGLYSAGGVLCTQCEPEAFRRITFFPDRPDVMARYRTTLTADAECYPVLLTNGNPVAHRQLADGRHQIVWDDPHPKPSYLFALVAGRLECLEERFDTQSRRSVVLRLYVEPGGLDRAGHAMGSIKRAMAWDEVRYGREYDLEVFNAVAISQYTMGAMENKGLNIFNDRYVLADPATATDRDYRDIDALVGHEYFHNWSGNRVTCRDWFQLALKEGFTVFREQQYVADHGWAAVRRIEDVDLLRTRQFVEDAGPLAHPVRPGSYREIDNFYTDTVYSKGAELVRMLATLLGEQDFRRGVDRFFANHDGEAVVVEDFLRCLSDASGRDLAQFARWYDRPGTPRLTVTADYDAAAGVYELQVEQAPLGEPAMAALHIPLAMGLLDGNGRPLPLRLEGEGGGEDQTTVLELRQHRHCFRFTGLARQPVPALLRGFSAPVEVHFDYTAEDLRLLAVHDPDPVVRWDAIQRLAGMCVRGDVEDADKALSTAFAAILDESDGDPGLAALLLKLPDVLTLADGYQEPDLEAIDSAREALAARLATALRDRFESVYQCSRDDGPYQPMPGDVGRRALRNTCLAYLATPAGPAAMDRCLAHYRQAGNMTDTLAALGLLANGRGPQRQEALADFRQRWQHQPLVMDKWLAVQARSSRPDTLECVLALMEEPLFSMEQPNRVRSLIEVFCADNPVAFHRPDGRGYCLLADAVLKIDAGNPQLAAGLSRYLVNRRGCNRQRRQLMSRELERIRAVPGLSPQTAEIVSSA